MKQHNPINLQSLLNILTFYILFLHILILQNNLVLLLFISNLIIKMIPYITYIYYNSDKEDLIVWENI